MKIALEPEVTGRALRFRHRGVDVLQWDGRGREQPVGRVTQQYSAIQSLYARWQSSTNAGSCTASIGSRGPSVSVRLG